jgi:hypothetical protein
MHTRHVVVITDNDDAAVVLSELIGFHSFHDKVKGLAEINLVQQGAELIPTSSRLICAVA